MESLDSRRWTLRSEGLRGGRAGVCRGVVEGRGGGRGGSAGEIFGVSGLGSMGWLARSLVVVGALLRMGGLLTVCWRW